MNLAPREDQTSRHHLMSATRRLRKLLSRFASRGSAAVTSGLSSVPPAAVNREPKVHETEIRCYSPKSECRYQAPLHHGKILQRLSASYELTRIRGLREWRNQPSNGNTSAVI